VGHGWRCRRIPKARKAIPPEQKHAQPHQHAKPRQGEAPVPAQPFPHIANGQGGGEGPQVNAEVEPAVSPVPLRVFFLVEHTHEGRNVGLQEPRSHTDEGKGQIERAEGKGACKLSPI
jgi:hypothetical protein